MEAMLIVYNIVGLLPQLSISLEDVVTGRL